MSPEERAVLIDVLETVYEGRITIEVQWPCGALRVEVEGESGDWTALIETINSPFRPVPAAGHRRLGLAA